MHPQDQTIFALSSGRPPSAIAIVRVSGQQAGAVLESLAGRIPSPRSATRMLLRDTDLQPIDEAVVLWFPGPASATGEDVAELHVHGGRAVLVALFAALSAFEHVRPAEPGEFTRRAFENGKLDLTEAEGLDDLIRADTDRQRRQALRQLRGLLGEKARDWRTRIVEACALIEAGIDFSDEGDVPAELIAPALAKVRTLLHEIEDVLAARGKGERLRDGLGEEERLLGMLMEEETAFQAFRQGDNRRAAAEKDRAAGARRSGRLRDRKGHANVRQPLGAPHGVRDLDYRHLVLRFLRCALCHAEADLLVLDRRNLAHDDGVGLRDSLRKRGHADFHGLRLRRRHGEYQHGEDDESTQTAMHHG